jgi:hypothetical protein
MHLERVLPPAAGERKTRGEPLHTVGGWQTSIRQTGAEMDGMTIGRAAAQATPGAVLQPAHALALED